MVQRNSVVKINTNMLMLKLTSWRVSLVWNLWQSESEGCFREVQQSADDGVQVKLILAVYCAPQNHLAPQHKGKK